ncbi:MAG: DNA polymerase I [Clostridiales Family XIII bacterium]|jgi:DNA polymerase-1|nr:DNA polymerase I [Clostridiales Family XIII bacterium]
MKKAILIDSNSLINRAFYAIRKPMITRTGIHTKAVYGFISMLNKILKDFEPDYIACAFDLKAKTFRHKKYADYKAKRKPAPEDLISQFPIIKDILDLMNIKIVEEEAYEADDILGTIAKKFEREKILSYIVTGDKDLLQLVSEYTKVVITKTGISNYEIFDIKKMDEVYGFSGDRFIDYKALMGDSSDNIPGIPGFGKKTAEKLIIKYKDIKGIYSNLDNLEYPKWKAKLLDDKNILMLSRELSEIFLKVPIKINISDFTFKKPDYNKLISLYKDLEFNQFLQGIYNEKNRVYPKFLAYENDDKKLVGYDVKEYFVSKKLLEYPEISFDIKIASYILDPKASIYSLEKLAKEYLPNISENDKKLVFDLTEVLKKKLKEEELANVFYRAELPLIKILAFFEVKGIKVSKEELGKIGEEVGKKLEKLKKNIYELAGEKFNINSPKQLSEILFEKLKLLKGKKTKTGYSTDVEELERLRGENKIVDYILSYRGLNKIKGTYVDGFIPLIENDGRIHSSFMQTVTTTGRLSSKNPNLQNLPIKEEQGRIVRKAFIPDTGKIFISADYSQIELRVLAELSGDEKLVNDFMENADIHKRTAARIFNLPEEKIDISLRNKAKAINFGIIYGMGAFTLAKDTGISVKKAERYIADYFNAYPKVFQFINQSIQAARHFGFVKTILGRKRAIPEIFSKNKVTIRAGERLAVNTRVQGSAADIMKLAMITVSNKLKKENLDAYQILQIHDEIVLEADIKIKEEAKIFLQNEMEKAYTLKVPLAVSVSEGETLYDLK